jgi:superfamily II DNA or RNA helicase
VAFFAENQAQIVLPFGISTIRDGEIPSSKKGLRRGQVGSINALSQHFSLDRLEPAIVVMPTGSGKTAVMMLSAFLLGAERVLVVTPSRLVRGQICEQFNGLALLRDIGVIAPSLKTSPRVFEVEKTIKSEEDWESLREYDVVVGTTNGVSPGHAAIPQPPEDLFDLILVDEAHHSAAKTWNQLLESFPNAKRILFTATPFRRDSREIHGTIVYTYSVDLALKDKVFGKPEYVPIEPDPDGGDELNDIRIAKEAERIFREDRAQGYEHFLVVRIDGKARSKELAEVYRKNTGLNLALVTSNLPYARIKQSIADLRHGKLDGVICVNMLGEGFDFPNLKIAAIHSPHRSLAVTLQFIGRFSRTNSSDIGTAKFLAIPNDIKIETTELYREDTAWEEIIPFLLDERVKQAVRTGERLRTFVEDRATPPDLRDLSLYALEPYHHVKVYAVTKDVQLDANIELGSSVELAFHRISDELQAAIFVTREITRPVWTNNDRLMSVNYHLFVVHWNRRYKLLFICSSARSEPLYEQLSWLFCPGGAWPLTHSEIKKATIGLTSLEFFHVGMRNRVLNNTSESYRTLSGSTPTRGIDPSDGVRYHEGHIFGRGLDGEKEVTIGLSSLSKIWSNTSTLVDELVDWCDALAERLSSKETVKTGSELDYLGTGSLAKSIPEHPIAADWDRGTYTNPCRIRYADEDGVMVVSQLLDCSLDIDHNQSSKERVVVVLRNSGLEWPIEFRIDRRPHFQLLDPAQQGIKIERNGPGVSLIDYLNGRPLRFYFADFSSLVGREILLPPEVEPVAFPEDQIEVINWRKERVDICREFGAKAGGLCSIHDYVGKRLSDRNYDFVLYDHGSGELADYIGIKDDGEALLFELYHCKKSKSKTAGERVDDLYEICGQVVKSVRWMGDYKRLRERIKGRISRKNPSQFQAGNMDRLDELIALSRKREVIFRIYAVQPGLSKAKCVKLKGKRLDLLLGMAGEYVRNARCNELIVLASA